MVNKFLVLTDLPDEYTGKKGLVKQQNLTLVDGDATATRCKTTFEYSLSEEEKLKFAGKLLNKVIDLAVLEFMSFGTRIRIRGRILQVPEK